MTDRQPLVAANWKMNGTLETLRPLVQGVRDGIAPDCDTEVVICPPSVYLAEVCGLLEKGTLKLGAQNVSEHEAGAYTGEVSIDMLKDYQCHYAIIGHSERRSLFGESDHTVADKFFSVHRAGLTPILCIGELLEEREAGNTEEVVALQLDAVIEKSGIQAFSEAVIVYEPVWAIGTGKAASPEQAQEVHAFMRLRLARHDATIADKIRVLYGGSVKATNANELFSMVDVDGGLIGGASLVVKDFLTICHAMR